MPSEGYRGRRAKPSRPNLRAAKTLSALLGAVLAGGLHRMPRRGFAILTYHRIAPLCDGQPAPTWNVTPQRFGQQLAGLLARGYRPVALSDAIACHLEGSSLPPHSFVVTFDDGYGNVLQHALPVLRKYRIPATLFLATAYIDQDEPFPFDDWALSDAGSRVPADCWRPLTWSECHELADSGWVELGCHTHWHNDYRGSPADLQHDVERSLQRLSDVLAIQHPAFSFPFGSFDQPLLDAARCTGVTCALTTQAQLVRPGDDPFGWGRFGVTEADSSATLAGKIDGWYSLLRGLYRQSRSPALPSARQTADPSSTEPVPTADLLDVSSASP